FCLTPAWATPVPLVTDSICFSGPIDSDPTIDSTLLDALIDYTFDPSTNRLTMVIYNNTASPNAYTLSELLFNVGTDVTGMSIFDDGVLSNTSLNTGVQQGGMGTFDFDFDGGQGNNGIGAGSSATVLFSVTGSNLDTGDFFNGLSTAPGDGNGHFIASIHFTRGPNDSSDWVTPCTNVVPEPATMSLLGIALAGIVVRHARKRKSA
ncbi:MAG: PEP-CTERM sorting domain-containing protein, partial [Candidatus Hydrogenedentes bacterium]|nr:PEP-CTERM sorting domain-containing protein [Candidatus Hydrogenedentota bacterium]